MATSTHSIENALNIRFLDPDFVKAMQEAWCFEACWPGCNENYPKNRDDNPSYGNCLVTVLAAWAVRGCRDDIIASIVNDKDWHFRLGVHGVEDSSYKKDRQGRVQIDPTWQQFEKHSVFREARPGTQGYKDIIVGSIYQDDSLLSRLEILLERLKSEGGYDVGVSAEEVIERVQRKFEPVFSMRPPPPVTPRSW